MPIFKAGPKLIYYAHVPKCGGSAVEHYLSDRFGLVAFQNTAHTARPKELRWTRTSPQHVDVDSLNALFPEDFFDASFAIVRHPESRLVSTYHFQCEVEKTISANISFSEWLLELADLRQENPFVYDNHVRPMIELVPEGAEVFHLEHGIDAMVPWLDRVTGQKTGMRAVPHVNRRGEYAKSKTGQVTLSEADRALIAQLYEADFHRFGYSPDSRAPLVAPPEMSAEALAERDEALETMARPLNKLKSTLTRALGR